MAFRGTYDHTLDAKNRLTVPSKFRPQLTETVVLTQGTRPCVAIYRPEEFEAHVDAYREGLHPGSTQAQQIDEFFQANAFDTEIDSAGRVMLPPRLMEYAGLGKDVHVVGVRNHIQIWDREAWAAHNETLSQAITNISDLLGGQNPS
jgi:MraZ protein